MGSSRADLMQARIDFLLRGLDGFDVLLADLLLDERAADQLIERLLPRELDLEDGVGIENGEADLVIEVAGQDDVLVDHGDGAIEDDGRRGEGSGCWAANVGSAERSSARTRNFAAALRRKATAGPSTPRGGKRATLRSG